MMNIEITQGYKSSLTPFSKEQLEPLNLPKETLEFLTRIGLPLRSDYEITPNIPLTFFAQPYVKKHSHFQNTYLYIASMDMMGLIAVDVKEQAVYQMLHSEKDSWGNIEEIPVLMNDSIHQFVDCFGLWLSFYPQLRAEINRQLEADPTFYLFDHEELYKSILKKLKEIDPQSMKWRKFFWRRMCEPDIV